MASIWVGTSGWAYKDWGREFYPPELPDKKRLSFLSQEFPTVEVNSSFYRLPAAATFASWRDQTPDQFQFAVKVSRLITHLKRLKEVDDNWRELRSRAGELGNKLGPFLLQFQSNFTAKDENLERLEHLLGCIRSLDKNDQLAFEFRHPTCFESPMLELLQKYQAVPVMADSSRYPHSSMLQNYGSFIYQRLHGPRELYASAYTDEELEAWAAAAAWHFDEGRDVYAYFDNDVNGYALADARKMSRLVHQYTGQI